MCLRIISASGLTKAHNYKCQVVLYAVKDDIQRAAWASRSFEAETPVAKNTQNPIFNHDVNIQLPKLPKMLDITFFDVGYTGSKEVGRIRLKFTNTPGVERTFDGKDLLYGFDRVIDQS